MTTVQRRVIQAGVLAVIALACLAELLQILVQSDRIIWALVPPGGPDLRIGDTFFSARTWVDVVVDIAPGSAFAFAGLIAWSVRPRNRVGLLMMGVGIGLLVGSRLGQKSSSALSFTLGEFAYPWTSIALVIFGALAVAMLIHLLLAFPGGRLVSRLDRALVRTLYVLLPVAALL